MEDHDGGNTNFEMDEQRRQLQELQQRLEQYENQKRGARHHDSESDNENPFHHAHSHSSGESTPLHPTPVLFEIHDRVLIERWTYQILKERCNQMISLIGLLPLSESLISKMFQKIVK